MDGQQIPKTADAIYGWATSSADNRLKFIIITHYSQVLARAQNAGLIRGAASVQDLFNVVKATMVSPALFANVLNITPDTSGMTDEAAEAWGRIFTAASPASKQARVAFSQQAPYYCAEGFTGPVPPNAPPCPTAQGSGFFNSDTFNTVISNLPGLGNAIACWVDPERCQSQPTPVPTPDGGNNSGNDQKTNYVPWIIGGSVAVIFIGVILFIVLRKK